MQDELTYRIKCLDLSMMSNRKLHVSGRLSTLLSLVKDGFYRKEKKSYSLVGT